MRQLLLWCTGILVGCLSMASACDPTGEIVPDVSAPISMNFDVDSPSATFEGLDTLDPNTNSDYRDHKAQISFLTIDQISLQVLPGSYPHNVTVNSAEMSWAHPDSSRFTSLGRITNKKLSDFENGQLFPTSAGDLNKLAAAVLASNKGIKLKYHFEADSAPFNFAAKATVRLKLKL